MALVHQEEMEQLEKLANRYLREFIDSPRIDARDADRLAWRIEALDSALEILGLKLCTVGDSNVERYNLIVDL